MASKFPKIASSKIRNQDSTPFFASLRDFLLGVKRQPITPPPGLPTEDGEAHYQPHNRFPNTQSARSIEPASTEEGIVRKIADNYYYSRDARRDVLPPPSVYDIGPHETACYAVTDGSVSAEGKNVGPKQNYGFNPKIPTPGFGYEWTRSIEAEGFTQQKDPDLARTQKFDKYLKA
uniref:NADH dehydrogenase [ubiquinone] 1 alpha subcomplex subunit 7 n=1 Tax=Meloidogyne hapla TaxID=6305 RepID=A0A1I8B264_MELHA